MNVTSDTLTILLTVYQRRFGSEYNKALEGQTWKDLVLRVPSTTLKEAVPFSGAAPRVQDTTNGVLEYEDIRQYLVEVSNRVFQAGWQIEREAFADDRYQLYAGKPGEMAEAAAEHPGEYIWELIELNGNAYDGLPFYSDVGAGRKYGKGAIVDNIRVGTGTTPTQLLADLNNAQIDMFNFETDKGRKIKRMGNLITCSINQFQAWFEALAILSEDDTGERVVVLPGEPIFKAGRYTVVVNPEATDEDNWQLHHVASNRKPFLMTDRQAPFLEGTISIQSKKWREERAAKYSTYGRYGRQQRERLVLLREALPRVAEEDPQRGHGSRSSERRACHATGQSHDEGERATSGCFPPCPAWIAGTASWRPARSSTTCLLRSGLR